MTTTESKRGIIALMMAHVAGMLDLVALPVWVGTLMSQYQFAPQKAGGLATLFLLGASVASMFLAPRFRALRWPARPLHWHRPTRPTGCWRSCI